mgnify:CR=1 FL=1
MSEPLLLGVDAGLTNVKAVAFDRSGTELAAATTETPGHSPAPGRDEQTHDDLWDAAVGVITEVLATDAVDPASVRGVGVAGHGHGLYALDESGEPVCGVKSTDDRGASVRDEWAEDGRLEAAESLLGWRPFGADPYCLLGWFDRERPAVADRIDTLLCCKDVLKHRLTGSRTTDPMDGSAFVPQDGTARAVLDVLDLGEYAHGIPNIVDSTAQCGTVTAEAASATGLPEGTPVAAGLHDVGACALGAGATDPGDATVILGTWGQSVVVTDGPEEGSGGLPRRYLDGWLRYRGTRAGAACLEWFVDEFGTEWRAEATDRGVDVYGFEPATDEHDIAGLKHSHSTDHYVPGTYEPAAVETLSFLPTDRAYEYVRWLHSRYADRSVTIADPGQWDRQLVREHLRVDGEFLVGPSSGACVAMVDRLASMGVLDSEDVVVIPFPDRGDRYPERDLRGTSSETDAATKPASVASSARTDDG